MIKTLETIRRIWYIVKDPLNDASTVANAIYWIYQIAQWILGNLF